MKLNQATRLLATNQKSSLIRCALATYIIHYIHKKINWRTVENNTTIWEISKQYIKYPKPYSYPK